MSKSFRIKKCLTQRRNTDSYLIRKIYIKRMTWRELTSFNFRRSGEDAVQPAAKADSQSSWFRGLSSVVGSQRREHRPHHRRRRAELPRHVRMRRLRQSAPGQEVHPRSVRQSWHVRATVEQLYLRLRHDQFHRTDL